MGGQTRGDRAGVRGGRGRGGAAPSPGQQRPPHKGGGAAGGRVEGPAAEQWAGAWQSAGFQLAQPPQLPLPPPLLTVARAATFAPCRVGSLGGSEVRAGKGRWRPRAEPGRGRSGAGRGGAVRRCCPGLLPWPLLRADPLLFIFLSVRFVIKRGLSIQRQAPFPDSSRGGRERAGPGRLPVPSHPAHRVARAGEATRARPSSPRPNRGRGFPLEGPCPRPALLLLFRPDS